MRVAAGLHGGSPSGSGLAPGVTFFFVSSFVRKHVVPLVTSDCYQVSLSSGKVPLNIVSVTWGTNQLFVMSQKEPILLSQVSENTPSQVFAPPPGLSLVLCKALIIVYCNLLQTGG